MKKIIKNFLFSFVIIFIFLTSFSGSQKTTKYTFTSDDLHKTEIIMSEQNNNMIESASIAAIKTGLEALFRQNKNVSTKNKRSV